MSGESNLVKFLLSMANDARSSTQTSSENGLKTCWTTSVPELGICSGGGKDGHESAHTLHFECLERFISSNEPFVLSGDCATADWRSQEEWVSKTSGKPAFNFLKNAFGSAVAAVADCNERQYNSQCKAEMQVSDYIDYWVNLIADDYDYSKHKCLYLKDWHFTRDFPNYGAYKIFDCFQSDWLNEFWDVRKDSDDDYRFVYMGPKGSWTPLHTDVFSSYSWSANVCGTKLWILFSPEEEANLRDVKGNLPYDVTAPQMTNEALFPRFSQVKRRIEIRQGPGQIVFVPSKWLHQVFNEEDTISINHNWFNGFNIHVIWKSLETVYENVQKEISDCRNMDGWCRQCQIVLKATHGMDYEEFLSLLLTIAKTRVESVGDHFLDGVSIGGQVEGSNHTINTAQEIVKKLEPLKMVVTQKSFSTMTCKIAQYIFDLTKIVNIFGCILCEHADNWEAIFDQPQEPIERLHQSLKDFLEELVPLCYN